LAELKNTSQVKGFRAEHSVIKLLESKNWNLEFQRLKTDIAEIDLIFEKSGEVILVEVKTLNNSWRAFDRIQGSQLKKLELNLFLFRKKFSDIHFRAFVAWVCPENKISFVEI
jgi:Holliday junction resolvase-like predicted endonuclease